MGGDWRRRWTQVTEHVAAMKTLWTTDPSEFHGTYVDFPPVRSFPKPRSQPHPPILIASMGSPKVFGRIIEWADGWIPIVQTPDELAAGIEQLRTLSRKSGRDPDQFSITVFGLQGQWRSLDEVAALEAAGAERVIICVEDASLEEILRELENLAFGLGL